MKPINHLIRKLASNASKTAALAIVVAGLLATSPMAFAACSFAWATPNPIHVPANELGFAPSGTLNLIPASNSYAEESITQSGDFTLSNLQVGYAGHYATASATNQPVSLPSSPLNVFFSAQLPYTATAGQTARVTLNVSYYFYPNGLWNPGNWGGKLSCSSTVTVVVDPICTGNAALIQSTFGVNGNFEVVVPNDQVSSPSYVPGAGMNHYYRDNSSYSSQPWYFDTLFEATYGTVEAVSLIESSGTLQVVTRIGARLAHFYRNDTLTWSGPVYFASGVSGTPSFIQSKSGNFEVVTPLQAGGVAHYSRLGKTWTSVEEKFATSYAVVGVSLIESSYGNLEVVANLGVQLAHFYRNSTGVWIGPDVFASGVSGTPSLVQEPSGATPGNFEVVAPLAAGGMALYSRNNSSYLSQPWSLVDTFSSGNLVSASMIYSNYGNLEVVARAGNCGMDHYWRNPPPAGQWSGPTVIVP